MRVAPIGPVAGAYYLDNSEVAMIEGPIGSGKSTASCLRLQRHAYQQAPGSDGVARTRFAIVRNTRQQLEDTTMKTWFGLFPEAQYGPLEVTDAKQVWAFRPQGYSHAIEAEFIFRALDKPQDVGRLLSLEVTGFWINEARELPSEIMGQLIGRCRYLGGDRPHTWRGWIADTNPWDTDHYMQGLFVDNLPEGWAHFMQPGGMDPDAENLENLEQTAETLALPYDDPRRREQGRNYYVNALKGMSKEAAEIYVHARRGASRQGKPIYTDFNDRLHCREFALDPRLPIDIGLDFGRTPAATIGQEFPGGRVQIAYELVAFDMGLVSFAEELVRFLSGGELSRHKIRRITGDPAGEAKDAHDETAFHILKGAGLVAFPAATNELSVRIETVQKAFRTLTDGHPALLIHPRCKYLRRACIDGYHYRKLNVAGDRYAPEPNKNEYSHVAEALQYHLMGLGHGAALVRSNPRLGSAPRPRFALT